MTSHPRIESLDLLKGLVMVIMALDHVRDYFHYSAFIFDPADPTQSTLPIFFTRWITHFCAPAFSFLAGMSAFMVGRRKTKKELSGFLLTRGLWLVFIEVTIVSFGWFFDVEFRMIGLLVIWVLGISMIFLAALIHLPRIYILLFSLLLICCHNLLDNINFQGNVIWSLLHQPRFYQLSEHTNMLNAYPLIPWIAIMSLGYYFGAYYNQSFDVSKRKNTFNIIGISAIVLFLVLRYTNLYGDPTPFVHYDTLSKNLISFFNPNKYPPSLQYVLMTIGAVFIFLANAEYLKGKVVNFFSTFGRVPFFYYILHIYLIHILAMIFSQLSGYGWQKFILTSWVGSDPAMRGYGFPLWVVYVVWIGVILMLYPLCKWFDRYKHSHKEKKWLSYL